MEKSSYITYFNTVATYFIGSCAEPRRQMSRRVLMAWASWKRLKSCQSKYFQDSFFSFFRHQALQCYDLNAVLSQNVSIADYLLNSTNPLVIS